MPNKSTTVASVFRHGFLNHGFGFSRYYTDRNGLTSKFADGACHRDVTIPDDCFCPEGLILRNESCVFCEQFRSPVVEQAHCLLKIIGGSL